MATSAAAPRAHRLSRIFSSTARSVQPPKGKPTPPKEAPAAVAGAESIPRRKERKDRKDLNNIVKGLLLERNPDKLVSGFIAASSKHPRFRSRHRVYGVAVSRLAKFGRHDGVEAIIDAQKPFLETSTEGFAARLIRLYGHASMVSHAAATFHDLPPQHKSTMTFNALLSSYAEAGEFDALAAAFKEIPASNPSVVPSVHSYNIILHALCNKPDLSAALDTVALMEKCGVLPDLITFNTLLNGFYNHGRLDGAGKVWEMMKERNIVPDVKSYNAKLRGLVAEGRIEDAVALLETMEKDGPRPDTVSYNELIRAYCKDGRLEEAKNLYEDLAKNACASNRGTYHALMPCVVKAGELDYALKCCYEIFSKKCRVDCFVLQEVVNALVTASRMEDAAKVVELGWKNNYPRRILKMPCAVEGDKVLEETDGEDSTPEEQEEHENP
ncbi:pentatricopeptide repeat-containing protein At1g55890, mitochondrial-like [Oryza brachyantha]|nr:pentatricopeptide repeat-containing protein At1g55890, mitochondrial-like [Oryza brachyantha]